MAGDVVSVDGTTGLGASGRAETPAQRAARHLAEAKRAAFAQVQLLTSEMGTLRQVAFEIVQGGPIYPAGVRDLCGQFLQELDNKAKSLEGVMAKVSGELSA